MRQRFFKIIQSRCLTVADIRRKSPFPLLEFLIKTYTSEGETVLDNCMGSGSTGVAAVNTGRSFIGIEKDGHYFEVARERIKEAEAALGKAQGENIL